MNLFENHQELFFGHVYKMLRMEKEWNKAKKNENGKRPMWFMSYKKQEISKELSTHFFTACFKRSI